MRTLLFSTILMTSVAIQAQTPRLSLYEEFTGETCPPCAATNPGLNALLLAPENEAKIVAIKWQVPIPSAPTKTWSLYQTNKAEIDWRYRSSASSGYGYMSQWTSGSAQTGGINAAPTGLIDGQHQWVFGASSDHPQTLTKQVISTAQSYTSAFSVTMRRKWDATLSSVNLTITIQATANFNAVGNLNFRTVMVERLIQFSVQPGTNGETTFEDVAIKSFPSVNGTSLTPNWTNGQSMTFTLNCPIPSYCRNKDQVAFVGFIQDDGNRKVAQAVRSGKQNTAANDLEAMSVTVPTFTCTSAFIPTVQVRNYGSTDVSSFVITPYIDGVAGTPYNWSGFLPADLSSTVIALNSCSTTIAGGHTFSVNINNVSGGDANLSNNNATSLIYVATGSQGTAVVEGFSVAAFPPPLFGVINQDGGPTFSRNGTVGAYNLSQQSAVYPCFDNLVKGDKDEFYLPELNMAGIYNPDISFDIAYAMRDANSNDRLQVMASNDCGATWNIVYDLAGSNLVTNLSQIPGSYVPDPADNSNWRSEAFTLYGYNSANLLVKFVVTNDNGNNIYLDNINLKQGTTTGLKSVSSNSEMTLYPNPSTGVFYVESAAGADVTVTNSIGQIVWKGKVNPGRAEVSLGNNANGIYFVTISKGAQTKVVKMIKQ